ncbi:MAG: hypothetical protein AB9869_22485 [Verrucomicrobiia bacterium]
MRRRLICSSLRAAFQVLYADPVVFFNVHLSLLAQCAEVAAALVEELALGV